MPRVVKAVQVIPLQRERESHRLTATRKRRCNEYFISSNTEGLRMVSDRTVDASGAPLFYDHWRQWRSERQFRSVKSFD